MQLILTDRIMMPPSGMYRFKVLSQEEFIESVRLAMDSDILNNMIVDPEVTGIVSEIVGQKIQMCSLAKSQEITLETGDKLLSVQVLIKESTEKKLLDPIGKPPMEQSIFVNVIQSTYYDETPEGLVAAAINCQLASDDNMHDWFFKLRETFNREVPITDIQEYKKNE